LYYFVTVVVFTLFIVLLIRWITGRMVSSITDVSEAAKRVAHGQYVPLPPTTSQDEVGQLVRSFNAMVVQLDEGMRLRQALDLAMEVQQSLLPQSPPDINGLDIAGKSTYCDETGGDYFDFLEFAELGQGRIGVAVGDVAGHGIAAALLMTTVRALLRSRIIQPGTLSQVLTDVNRLLCIDTSQSVNFMTLFLMLIDPVKHEIHWVRAGHDPAIIYDASANSFEELRGDGIALGVDDSFSFQEYRYQEWTDGRIILIGTDGIWETENPQGQLFGKERLREIVRQHSNDSSQTILQAITDTLATFRHTAPQEDDITMVVIKTT
jgi:sigma-B regulation protein RsbU (phosphoserine phosphatase)